jgi:pyruvate kinase
MKRDKLLNVNEKIRGLIKTIEQKAVLEDGVVKDVVLEKRQSASNLQHYMIFRNLEVSELQKMLGKIGLSRFAHAENHILHALRQAGSIVDSILKEPSNILSKQGGISASKAKKILTRNTKNLLGRKSKEKRVRIMVTLPHEAAFDQFLVDELVLHGMNSARINCAHDDAAIWKQMIEKVRKAASKYKKSIKISMDLAGPKIRTGEMFEGSRVLKLSPKVDDFGNFIEPAQLILVAEKEGVTEKNAIGIDSDWLNKLQVNDKIRFKDARGKSRQLDVINVSNNRVTTICNKVTFLVDGIIFSKQSDNNDYVLNNAIKPIESYLILKMGEEIIVQKSGAGTAAQYSADGSILDKAKITCTMPEIVDYVKQNERIFFDDGKIEGVIVSKNPNSFLVKITKCKPGGAKLRSDKGINLPDSELKINGLTPKDIEDLKFISANADIVNFSFVNTPADLIQLYDYLDRYNKANLGVVLKIETKKAFNNLPMLLLTGMTKESGLGIMIARGDLAIEVGWQKIGHIQNEILRICNAAHVPIIWATQVLESLTKKGIPSRSEMTDITQSLKAECVMLNKGPFILETLELLTFVLKNDEMFQNKSESLLPAMAKLD